MKLRLLLSFIVIFSSLARAAAEELSAPEVSPEISSETASQGAILPADAVIISDDDSIILDENWELHPVITLGAAVLFEKTNDQRFQNSVLPPLFGVGMRLDQDFSRWTARIEYSVDESLDGNPTLSVRRKRQAALAWATRDLGLARGWVPYVGLGSGFVQSEIVTTLNGASETGAGGWKGAFAGAVGFRADWSEILTVRAELRYESAESFKTNDARSGVAVYLENSF
jgi:opacity protein-like surface antigen